MTIRRDLFFSMFVFFHGTFPGTVFHLHEPALSLCPLCFSSPNAAICQTELEKSAFCSWSCCLEDFSVTYSLHLVLWTLQ